MFVLEDDMHPQEQEKAQNVDSQEGVTPDKPCFCLSYNNNKKHIKKWEDNVVNKSATQTIFNILCYPKLEPYYISPERQAGLCVKDLRTYFQTPTAFSSVFISLCFDLHKIS